MLKHVTYRSNSALGQPNEFNYRTSVSSSSFSLKNDTRQTSEMDCKTSRTNLSNLSGREGSLTRFKNIRDELQGLENMSLSNFQNPDSVSLTSAMSFSSLATGKYSSRCSSTISLNDQPTTPVKVYLRRLRADMEYKTVPLASHTTARELIISLLTKFRLRHRDPNLFVLMMEVTVRSPSDGAPVKRRLVLDDNARPAELQQCRPKGEANFSIGVRRGGLVRVHDSILNPGSQYKSLLVSYHTTCDELVQLLLNCCNRKENSRHYTLHEICRSPYTDNPLRPEEYPIQVQAAWPKDGKTSWAFVLRRNISYTLSMKSKLSWRRSLDQSSTDTESEVEDHNTTRASIMSSSSTISNSSSLSSTSNLSSSSGVSSDSSSTCSSSGVSSGDSLISSPVSTPSKPLTNLTSTPSSTSKSEVPNPRTPNKPPKPVPRTLFPPLSPLPKKILSASTINISNDSGVGLNDSDFRPELPPRSSTISSGSKYYSNSNSNRSTAKILSKSSVNLNLISPIKNSMSKSYLNLSMGMGTDSRTKMSATPKAATLSTFCRPTARRTSNDSRMAYKQRSSSVSSFTNIGKEYSCSHNCKNCFYI